MVDASWNQSVMFPRSSSRRHTTGVNKTRPGRSESRGQVSGEPGAGQSDSRKRARDEIRLLPRVLRPHCVHHCEPVSAREQKGRVMYTPSMSAWRALAGIASVAMAVIHVPPEQHGTGDRDGLDHDPDQHRLLPGASLDHRGRDHERPRPEPQHRMDRPQPWSRGSCPRVHPPAG